VLAACPHSIDTAVSAIGKKQRSASDQNSTQVLITGF
jgi:hypothetical protein